MRAAARGACLLLLCAAAAVAEEADAFSPVEYANLLAGSFTKGDVFSTGNTMPLVGRPWGFNHWALQTNDGQSSWWFNGNDHEMGGFTTKPTGFEPRSGRIKPHAMDFRTAPDGMRGELAPTMHGAGRVTFPGVARGEAGLLQAAAAATPTSPRAARRGVRRTEPGGAPNFNHHVFVEAVSGSPSFESHGHDTFCFGYPSSATTVELTGRFPRRFRTVYPLLALVYPDHLGWIVDGWVNAYREAAGSPRASPGYRNSMVGTYGDVVVAEAIVKGVGGFDEAAAWDALHKDATGGPGRRRREEERRVQLPLLADAVGRRLHGGLRVAHSFPPFDVELLASLHGGKDGLVKQIMDMLDAPSTFEAGGYARRSTMREMRWPWGQYGHNNQPSHHILWLLHQCGRADLGNKHVRRVIDDAYMADAVPGEDNGRWAPGIPGRPALDIYARPPDRP
ncbi:glycosyl hydrolase [Aureococcus anophagefferens]|nr:glycosyl hydrolase [Aureococcus anophagefferens]